MQVEVSCGPQYRRPIAGLAALIGFGLRVVASLNSSLTLAPRTPRLLLSPLQRRTQPTDSWSAATMSACSAAVSGVVCCARMMQASKIYHLLIDLRSETAAYKKMEAPIASAVSSPEDRLRAEPLPCANIPAAVNRITLGVHTSMEGTTDAAHDKYADPDPTLAKAMSLKTAWHQIGTVEPSHGVAIP